MDKKESIFEPVRRWWRYRKFIQAKKALEVMVLNKDPEIYGQIRGYAETMARNMCMKWLDNKGIQHCAKCPNTAPLIKLSGSYFCTGHASIVAKDGKEQVANLQVVSG